MPRKPDVDMSPEAIDARLRRGAQLYRLARELTAAPVIGTVDEAHAASTPADEEHARSVDDDEA